MFLKKIPLKERFEAKLYYGLDGCWYWLGSLSNKGYGKISIRTSVHAPAHRVSFELYHGKIPYGMCVLHRCDNPACVNPDHLFLGTLSDNTQDMLKKGRDRLTHWVGKPNINRLDLAGQKFGMLTAISFETFNKNGQTAGRWLCKCDCGNDKKVEASFLISSNTRSCGCMLSGPKIKLTTEQVAHIRQKVLTGKEYCELYGVSSGFVTTLQNPDRYPDYHKRLRKEGVL